MNEIVTIWKVGSPHDGGTPANTLPDEIAQLASELSLGCHVTSFPAIGFHLVFAQALQNGRPPDIIEINNYGILEGIVTKLGAFTGLFSVVDKDNFIFVRTNFDSLHDDKGGWILLFKGSLQHKAVLKMAGRKAPLPADWVKTKAPPDHEIDAVRSTALSAIEAFLDQHPYRLWNLLDPNHMMIIYNDRFRVPIGLPDLKRGLTMSRIKTNEMITDIEVARIWGNHQLAFCGGIYARPMNTQGHSIGGGYVTVALRKSPGDQWRVLYVSSDPVTIEQLSGPIPELALQLTSIDTGVVEPAQLIAPPDGEYPMPLETDVLGEDDDESFGFFVWKRSPATTLIAELVEFGSFDDLNTLIVDTRAVVMPLSAVPSPERISSGMLWTVGDRWQWRVWSIAADGSIALSTAHEFYH